MSLDEDAICPGCNTPIGDHTIRGYSECLKAAGFNYELPFQEVPDGPFELPNGGGLVAGEVVVAAAIIPTALGVLPALRFTFVGPGEAPMSRRELDPITLIMDDIGLDAVGRLVRQSIRSACAAAKRAS